MSFIYPQAKIPDDAKRYHPAGAPPWPPMFLHDNGDISVILRHPTPLLKSVGSGIGCAVLLVLPLVLPLLFFAADTTAAGRSACCLYILAFFIGAFGIEKAGAYIACLLNGPVIVIFKPESIVIDRGQNKKLICRERLARIAISFQPVEIPDLQRRLMGKGPNLRADLMDQRRIVMRYGNETIEVTTMMNKDAAVEFVSALHAARDESVRSPVHPTAPKQRPKGAPIDPRDLPQ